MICHLTWALGQMSREETSAFDMPPGDTLVLTSSNCSYCGLPQTTSCCKGCHTAEQISQAMIFHNKGEAND